MHQSIRSLPDAELEVMQAVWACTPPVRRSAIEEKLSRPMASTTLLTLLSRLTEKGFLRSERVGRTSWFTPLVAREDYQAQQSRSFLDRVCGGSIPALASALCSSGLSREELEQLRDLLERGLLL